jgi:DNA primase
VATRKVDDTFREQVRLASPVESVIPALTRHALSSSGAREPHTLCPFHPDHDPSLRISVEKQLWYCGVCQKGGDVFKFVQLHEGVRFPGALAFLAERAGIRRPSGAGCR